MIGREYKQCNWVINSAARGNTAAVVENIESSIEKWQQIDSHLRQFDCNTSDNNPLETIVETCGVCWLYQHIGMEPCGHCPLRTDEGPCYEHEPYSDIYMAEAECGSWQEFVDECGQKTMKYASDLIAYLKGLIKHIEENK